MQSGQQIGWVFGANVFEVKFDVVSQLHVHDVFQQSQQNVFSTGLHFCFWKLLNIFANVFDVLGIWQEDANGQIFLEQHGEFEQVEFTAFEWEEVLETVLFWSCCACRRCFFYYRADQLEQEKSNMQAACARHAG